ncbi:MAG: hypothetical protein U5O39_05555 [Gammaproteobacteria bacterium]|nr:hypothetical protein [Gammaproteobacteria bacterium]
MHLLNRELETTRTFEKTAADGLRQRLAESQSRRGLMLDFNPWWEKELRLSNRSVKKLATKSFFHTFLVSELWLAMFNCLIAFWTLVRLPEVRFGRRLS